ncbi:hypothetical protein [Armatimonas sp.]|uniref:hypothetical protein n=1 Tax=Armatimonas sp. TaxID=1872638 RepID=UPI00374D5502
MNPEDALLNYLYPRLVEALQTWKGFDDIYGIWIVLSLTDDNFTRPCLDGALCLRKSGLTPERLQSQGESIGGTKSIWTPNLAAEEFYFPKALCFERKGRSLLLAFYAWKRSLPDYVPQRRGERIRERDVHETRWFVDICGSLIRRLHTDGTLQNLFGKPIPLGMLFSNDIDQEIPLPQTRDNNPDRLSQGMEEWMMKNTYAQIAAYEAFCAEVFAWPLERQARFYAQAMLGCKAEKRGMASTPEWEWAREKGRSGMGLDWTSPAAHLFLGQVLPEIEKRATAKRSFPSGTYPETEQADDLLSFFWIPSDYLTRLRSPIPETDIDRLYALLKRLYKESKTLEEIGSTLRHTARALNDLCPERFPVAKIGWRKENMNRLLEPEKFGLE